MNSGIGPQVSYINSARAKDSMQQQNAYYGRPENAGMTQAKKDNVSVMEVLDTLRPSSPVVISQLVAEVLNSYRYKTSVLGYKNDKVTNNEVTRNILP